MTGAVPDIRPWLLGASVAVAPMRIARGIQNKILEAMAMGIPMVTSTKAAAALEPELAPLVIAENDPAPLAGMTAQLVKGTSASSRRKLHEAIVSCMGSAAVQLRLETLLLQATSRTGQSAKCVF